MLSLILQETLTLAKAFFHFLFLNSLIVRADAFIIVGLRIAPLNLRAVQAV